MTTSKSAAARAQPPANRLPTASRAAVTHPPVLEPHSLKWRQVGGDIGVGERMEDANLGAIGGVGVREDQNGVDGYAHQPGHQPPRRCRRCRRLHRVLLGAAQAQVGVPDEEVVVEGEGHGWGWAAGGWIGVGGNT